MVCSKLQIKRYEYKQFLKFSKIHSINTSKILNRCLEKSAGENISSIVTSCLQFLQRRKLASSHEEWGFVVFILFCRQYFCEKDRLEENAAA